MPPYRYRRIGALDRRRAGPGKADTSAIYVQTTEVMHNSPMNRLHAKSSQVVLDYRCETTLALRCPASGGDGLSE
jgi:hypothetical protein